MSGKAGAKVSTQVSASVTPSTSALDSRSATNEPAAQDSATLRATLRVAIDAMRDALERGGVEAERDGTLPRSSVELLRKARVFELKLPRCLGGLEADLLTQMQAIEALAYVEPSTAWCVAVGATGIGEIGAFVHDAALATIFGAGAPIAGYTITPPGTAKIGRAHV